MNTHGFDRWWVEFSDGEQIDYSTVNWREIAQPREFGGRTLVATIRPICWISTFSNNSIHALRVDYPAAWSLQHKQPQTVAENPGYAFRHYYSRVDMTTQGKDELTGYEFGIFYPKTGHITGIVFHLDPHLTPVETYDIDIDVPRESD